MDEQKQAFKEVAKESGQSDFWDFIRYIIIALLIVIPFRMFIAQPYIVSGASMDPTFKDGDYLIVDQISKRFSKIERGSVVIIRYPKDPSKFFIKRLIAFPNEKIEIKNGKVTIFNESNPKGLKLSDAFVEHQKADNLYVELKNNEYFVMGDNRANSSDSRVWGSVPENFIIGVPLVRLLPLNKIGFNPGQFEIYEKR